MEKAEAQKLFGAGTSGSLVSALEISKRISRFVTTMRKHLM